MDFDIGKMKDDEKANAIEQLVITQVKEQLTDNLGDELLKAKVALRLSLTGWFCVIVGLVLLFVPMNNNWFIAISFGLFYAVGRSVILIMNMLRNQ